MVSDSEILKAQKQLASKSGLFAEPASSASWAGFIKMRDDIEKDAVVVVLMTGNGLKDINGALKGLEAE